MSNTVHADAQMVCGMRAYACAPKGACIKYVLVYHRHLAGTRLLNASTCKIFDETFSQAFAPVSCNGWHDVAHAVMNTIPSS